MSVNCDTYNALDTANLAIAHLQSGREDYLSAASLTARDGVYGHRELSLKQTILPFEYQLDSSGQMIGSDGSSLAQMQAKSAAYALTLPATEHPEYHSADRVFSALIALQNRMKSDPSCNQGLVVSPSVSDGPDAKHFIYLYEKSSDQQKVLGIPVEFRGSLAQLDRVVAAITREADGVPLSAEAGREQGYISRSNVKITLSAIVNALITVASESDSGADYLQRLEKDLKIPDAETLRQQQEADIDTVTNVLLDAISEVDPAQVKEFMIAVSRHNLRLVPEILAGDFMLLRSLIEEYSLAGEPTSTEIPNKSIESHSRTDSKSPTAFVESSEGSIFDRKIKANASDHYSMLSPTRTVPSSHIKMVWEGAMFKIETALESKRQANTSILHNEEMLGAGATWNKKYTKLQGPLDLAASLHAAASNAELQQTLRSRGKALINWKFPQQEGTYSAGNTQDANTTTPVENIPQKITNNPILQTKSFHPEIETLASVAIQRRTSDTSAVRQENIVAQDESYLRGGAQDTIDPQQLDLRLQNQPASQLHSEGIIESLSPFAENSTKAKVATILQESWQQENPTTATSRSVRPARNGKVSQADFQGRNPHASRDFVPSTDIRQGDTLNSANLAVLPSSDAQNTAAIVQFQRSTGKELPIPIQIEMGTEEPVHFEINTITNSLPQELLKNPHSGSQNQQENTQSFAPSTSLGEELLSERSVAETNKDSLAIESSVSVDAASTAGFDVEQNASGVETQAQYPTRENRVSAASPPVSQSKQNIVHPDSQSWQTSGKLNIHRQNVEPLVEGSRDQLHFRFLTEDSPSANSPGTQQTRNSATLKVQQSRKIDSTIIVNSLQAEQLLEIPAKSENTLNLAASEDIASSTPDESPTMISAEYDAVTPATILSSENNNAASSNVRNSQSSLPTSVQRSGKATFENVKSSLSREIDSTIIVNSLQAEQLLEIPAESESTFNIVASEDIASSTPDESPTMISAEYDAVTPATVPSSEMNNIASSNVKNSQSSLPTSVHSSGKATYENVKSSPSREIDSTIVVNSLQAEQLLELKRNPETVGRVFDKKENDPVILDEIQKINTLKFQPVSQPGQVETTFPNSYSEEISGSPLLDELRAEPAVTHQPVLNTLEHSKTDEPSQSSSSRTYLAQALARKEAFQTASSQKETNGSKNENHGRAVTTIKYEHIDQQIYRLLLQQKRESDQLVILEEADILSSQNREGSVGVNENFSAFDSDFQENRKDGGDISKRSVPRGLQKATQILNSRNTDLSLLDFLISMQHSCTVLRIRPDFESYLLSLSILSGLNIDTVKEIFSTLELDYNSDDFSSQLARIIKYAKNFETPPSQPYTSSLPPENVA